MKYPHFIRKWWFCEEENFPPTSLGSQFLLGFLWFFVALFFYSYLQESWVSALFLKIEVFAFILLLLIIPLMRRSVVAWHIGMAFIFFHLALGFFFKIGEICLAHIYVGNQYRFSDSLNLPYPDNWIVFGICLLPLLGVYFTAYYVGSDFKAWYERCKLPRFIDLKKGFCAIEWSNPDKSTDKLLKKIVDKYDKGDRHDRENKWYQFIFRWVGQAAMAIFILSSLGAQAYPFVLHGSTKNGVMLLGYVMMGTGLSAGISYFIRRAHFQYLFEKDLGVHLIPVIAIPDYKPEMNEGIVISKEPVEFPKNQSGFSKWFNSL